MEDTRYPIVSLNIGQIETLTFGARTFQTAIRKQPVQTPIYLTKTGLTGDEQAYKDHGGEDKALCLYSFDHYQHWRGILHNWVDTALFGENLTVRGLHEQNAHIGDIFACGEAVIQVSEPRNPCSKLAAKYEVPNLVAQVAKTGFTGFLFRVLQEGMVSPTDELVLLEKHPRQVSVALVNDVRFNDQQNMEKLHNVLSVDALSDSMRAEFSKKA